VPEKLLAPLKDSCPPLNVAVKLTWFPLMVPAIVPAVKHQFAKEMVPAMVLPVWVKFAETVPFAPKFALQVPRQEPAR
jgi:hypothetical protein